MKPIRGLMADDHPLLRAGLRGLLASLEGVEVVGEAADGLRALELVATQSPEILITDIAMPRLDGLALTAAVTRDHPATRVIILSLHTEWAYADRAMRAGAVAYLAKDRGTAEIEIALRAVARGECYLSSAISQHLVAGYRRLAEAEATAADPLTPRQREVLILIAHGLTTKAIARRLEISVKTTETHRVQLMERLGIREIAGLVRYALRNRLVKEDD